MRRTILISSLALLGGCVASSALIGASQKDARTEKTIPAGGIKSVKASIEVGSLKLRTDSAGDVRVTAIRHVKGGTDADQRRWLEETKVEVDRQGDSVVIKDVVPESLKNQKGKDRTNSNLELEIRIPRGLSVESAMGVGDIRADGAFSALKLRSGVGHIEVAGDAGELSIVTGVGNLKVTDLAVTGASLELNTGVGDVDAALRRIPSKDLKVKSGVGNTHVRIPSASRATVKLRSGVGIVKSDFSLTAVKRGPVSIGGDMHGDINGGGTALTVNSGTGNVNLNRSGGDG